MRRFLSWVTLILSISLVAVIMDVVLLLTSLVYSEIDRLSRILYIAAIIFGCSTIIGIISYIIKYGILLPITLSQLVWKSKNGLRYKTIGVFYCIYYLFFIVLYIVKHQQFIMILSFVCMFIISFGVLSKGPRIAYFDGAPPTKQERLQAKIDRLNAKEKKKNIVG